MTKLKSCPFCGSEAKEVWNIAGHRAYCSNKNCFMTAGNMSIEIWNTRAPDPRLKKAVEEIEARINEYDNPDFEEWTAGEHYAYNSMLSYFLMHFPEVKDE